MRILRLSLIFFLVGFTAAAGCFGWVQTPAGAKWVSGRMTEQLKSSAPGTRVDVEKIHLEWPPALAAERAVWSDADGRPILHLVQIRLVLSKLKLPLEHSAWEGSAEVARLDLAALDQAAVHGELRANGFLHGSFRFRQEQGRPEDLELKLESRQPGGNINSRVIAKLQDLLPPNDPRALALKIVGAKAIFHFDVGKLDLATEGESRILKILLDGDHLLDLTIRVPKEFELPEGFEIPDIPPELLRFFGFKPAKEKR